MDFQWKEVDGDYILYGYYDQVIAKLHYWNGGVWELSSDWLDCSTDLSIEIEKKDINEAKLDAVDELKRACEEHINWYKGQIEMLNDMNGGE